jgi:hypothetical protein
MPKHEPVREIEIGGNRKKLIITDEDGRHPAEWLQFARITICSTLDF